MPYISNINVLTFIIKEIHVENRLRLFSTDIMSEKNKQSLFFSPEIQSFSLIINIDIITI